MGVDVDVEFCCRRDVSPFEITAAHQHNLGHAARDVRGFFKRCGDVGQGAKRAKRHGTGGKFTQLFDDEINGMTFGQRHRRVGQVGAVKAAFSVDMFGGNKGAPHGAVAAGKDFDIAFACKFADDARVLLRQIQRHIARNARQAQNFDFFGACEGQQNCDRVVLAGVCVDDDLAWLHGVVLVCR